MKLIEVGNGFRFWVRHDRDAQIAQEVCGKQVYRRPRLGFGVSAGEHWLDLGGNIGAFAVWAAKNGCSVTTVEACSENCEVIEKNLRENGVFAEVVHGFASPAASGETRVIFNSATPGRSGAWAKEGKHTQVEMSPNFHVAGYISSRKPNGIKIDIEGGEFAILDDPRIEFDGVSKVALEYHYRFDKSCENARSRIAGLLRSFKRNTVSKQTLTADEWGGWVDEVMLFWGKNDAA